MNRKIFTELTNSAIENDVVFPYWIYKIEPVTVAKKHYLKIYMFNRLFDQRPIKLLGFSYEGNMYRADTFSQVSEFNNPDIVGCAVEVYNEYSGKGITVFDEIVGSQSYHASSRVVQYSVAQSPNNNANLLQQFPKYRSHNAVFPQVKEYYWQCSCGRIHSIEEKNCSCGQTVDEALEISEYNSEERQIQRYLKKPVQYDLKKSFEENIRQYKSGIINPDKNEHVVDEHIDLETEKRKYDSLLAKKKSRSRKKTLIATIVGLVIVSLGVLVGRPIYYYNRAVAAYENKQYIQAAKDIHTCEIVPIRTDDYDWVVDLIDRPFIQQLSSYGNWSHRGQAQNGQTYTESIVFNTDHRGRYTASAHPESEDYTFTYELRYNRRLDALYVYTTWDSNGTTMHDYYYMACKKRQTNGALVIDSLTHGNAKEKYTGEVFK